MTTPEQQQTEIPTAPKTAKPHFKASPEAAECKLDEEGRFTESDLTGWDEGKHREPLMAHFAQAKHYHLWKSKRYRTQAHRFDEMADEAYARFEQEEAYESMSEEERAARRAVDAAEAALASAKAKLEALG